MGRRWLTRKCNCILKYDLITPNGIIRHFIVFIEAEEFYKLVIPVGITRSETRNVSSLQSRFQPFYDHIYQSGISWAADSKASNSIKNVFVILFTYCVLCYLPGIIFRNFKHDIYEIQMTEVDIEINRSCSQREGIICQLQYSAGGIDNGDAHRYRHSISQYSRRPWAFYVTKTLLKIKITYTSRIHRHPVQ